MTPGDHAEAVPQCIGPFHILELLGEGAMGTVYLAEQRTPLFRRVALKLLRLGADSAAFVSRFERERQALALMDHDGIAKVLDCGTDQRGRPWLAMELARGMPIDRYCDRHRLPLSARLRLLQLVCDAVQHAHQKGVVHRDLKPAHVLVADDGSGPRVKVIDFGLAKAVGPRLTTVGPHLRHEDPVGTPEYMAPEQADPDNPDVDTRADIYSLGVLLYQLLTGQLPFAGTELTGRGRLELQRVLLEVEPPRPSLRLRRDPAAAAVAADLRGTTLDALVRDVRHDLDSITMQALAKDRDRRYQTAIALRDDLQRHLQHEATSAGPTNAGHRLRKFVRRNRARVFGALAVFVSCFAASVVATITLLDAKRAQAREHAARELLDAKLRDFDDLACVTRYDRLIVEDAALHPAWPDKVGALQRWLDEAGALLQQRGELELRVEAIRRHARAPTEVERATDRLEDPALVEIRQLEAMIAALDRARAVRAGATPASIPLTVEQRTWDAVSLNEFAWNRASPMMTERFFLGEEANALAAALRAVELASSDELPNCLDTLAWTYLANGLDKEARQAGDRALELDPRLGPDRAQLESAIVNVSASYTAATQRLAELLEANASYRRWRFPPTQDGDSLLFLHDTLVALPAKLVALEAEMMPAVRRRLHWAQAVREATARADVVTWAATRRAIASNPRYSGQVIDLSEDDTLGLVPLGENPNTHLWEFYDLASAWDGASDPRTIALPARGADGEVQIGASTGIVFALIPGGSFVMGAQSEAPNARNYDDSALQVESPTRAMAMAPFFLARCELTRAQWERLRGSAPFFFETGGHYDKDDVAIGPQHPAESISWNEAATALAQHGLCLPTEAQWEYACRANGEPGPLGNVHDVVSAISHPEYGRPVDVPDGFAAIAPVARTQPNGFGLLDMRGNVSEWCEDHFAPYSDEARPGDGLRLTRSALLRVARGGNFASPERSARITSRRSYLPETRASTVGVRPARRLQPR